MSDEIVIVGAKRTAVGNFGGSLKDVAADVLGVAVLRDLFSQTGLSPDAVDELIIGNILSAGLGQNLARQIQIKAGISDSKHAFAINMLCGSGLKAIELGYNSIKLGNADVVVCGGVENMSRSPYLLLDNRFGKKMGDSKAVDSMINDGLWDCFNNYHMGITAENVAAEYKVSRSEQDEFALKSQQKAIKAINSGVFDAEITPIEIPSKKEKIIFKRDEFARETTLEKLSALKPAFSKDGTVTAGNASGINDGASIVILARESRAKELGLKPLGKILSFGISGVNPAIMGIGPIEAVRKAVARAGLNLRDIELFELNEAFAAQSVAVVKTLGINEELVNVNGGAIALGHPIGASGARIFTTLVHEMGRRKTKLGVASLCIGGGMGIAAVVAGA